MKKTIKKITTIAISSLFYITLNFVNKVYAQQPNSFYLAKVNLVSQNNITSKLQDFENLGVKSVGTTAQENTYQWLKNQYLSFGYTESDINTYNFTYANSNNKNLEVTKRGSLYPNTYVIVCGHFDTINGAGVNDNGSGVISILEIARILKDVQTDYSVKFINFSGEEDGLIGSRNYVANVVNGTTPKMDIRVLLNIDEVGGVAGVTNNKVYCERDESFPTTNNALSNQFNQELAQYVRSYSNLTPVVSRAYASDYMPFQANNEVIVGLFEFNESSHPHTPTDLLVNMDPVYNFEVTKAATAAVLHFANARENLSIENSNKSGIKVYPNPAKKTINVSLKDAENKVKVSLFDTNGGLVLEDNLLLSSNSFSIDSTKLTKGLYLLKIMSKTTTFQQKVLIN